MSKPPLMGVPLIHSLNHQGYENYLPTAFDESLSLLQKVNKALHTLNQLGQLTNEMIERWNSVYQWVLNEGLEEAVKDKLEEWLKDGTLADLIDLVLLGSIKDRMDELEKTILDLSNLIDKLVLDIEELKKNSGGLSTDGYYMGLTTEFLYDATSLCHYQVTKIPHLDNEGKIIPLKLGISKDSVAILEHESARSFAARHNATFVSNGATFSDNSMQAVGMVIKDGNILQEKPTENWNYVLAFDNQNNLKAYPPNTAATKIVSDGYTNALAGFAPIIIDGVTQPDNVIFVRDEFKEYHARQWIAQDSQKNLYFFTSEGLRAQQRGMDFKDTARVTKTYLPNVQFAYNLDGGGSSQQVLYGSTLTEVYDGSGPDDNTQERKVANFLYIGKDETEKKTIGEIFTPVGQAIQMLQKRINRLENGLSFIPYNRIELAPYLLNGYTAAGASGGGKPWAYITANNFMVLMGTIKGGQSAQPFLKLPVGINPVFSQHFLTAGNAKGEIYKIMVNSDRTMQAYYWTDQTTELDYIRLDGVMFPILPTYWDGLWNEQLNLPPNPTTD